MGGSQKHRDTEAHLARLIARKLLACQCRKKSYHNISNLNLEAAANRRFAASRLKYFVLPISLYR